MERPASPHRGHRRPSAVKHGETLARRETQLGAGPRDWRHRHELSQRLAILRHAAVPRVENFVPRRILEKIPEFFKKKYK